MNVWELTLLIWLCSIVAGFLGSLTGLGGGLVIVPTLALVFHIDIRYAIGASLVSVIATSSGAAVAYVKEGFSNIRIGMFLEVATTLGALSGALLATRFPPSALAVSFGFMLLALAYFSGRKQPENPPAEEPDPIATRLKLEGAYPTEHGMQHYQVHSVPFGFALSYVAGIASGLLGIGGGAFKVLAMDQVMGMPFKASTATSNFMIGVTAAASAAVYLKRGYIEPGLAMPVMLGVLAGSVIGARVLAGAGTRVLRFLFAAVLVVLGIELIYKGLTGSV